VHRLHGIHFLGFFVKPFLKSFGCVAAAKDGAWCVCRADQPDASLQKTLDYACGTGADCNPIQPSGGACFAPDAVRAHCSYAVNSFFQRNNQNQQACVFSGTATLVTNDPSNLINLPRPSVFKLRMKCLARGSFLL
jgi:hypothetical protein